MSVLGVFGIKLAFPMEELEIDSFPRSWRTYVGAEPCLCPLVKDIYILSFPIPDLIGYPDTGFCTWLWIPTSVGMGFELSGFFRICNLGFEIYLGFRVLKLGFRPLASIRA
jgi:hypothetical protein